MKKKSDDDRFKENKEIKEIKNEDINDEKGKLELLEDKILSDPEKDRFLNDDNNNKIKDQKEEKINEEIAPKENEIGRAHV